MILDFGYLCMTFRLNLPNTFNFPCHITTNKTSTYAGGSATNQAIAAARSGAKTAIIGTVGNDVFGKTILDTLRKEGINSSGIAKSDTPTGIIHTLINESHQTAEISSSGANVESTADQIPDMMLNERALVLLQNDITVDISLDVLKRAKKRKALSIMCISHIKNINENMFDYLDIAIIDDSDIQSLCSTLSIRHGEIVDYLNKEKGIHCVITKDNGLSGACATSKNGEKHKQIIKPKLETANNAKTFDSFCGTFTSCIQGGLDLQKSTQYAISAASLTQINDDFPYLGDIQDNLAR